MRAGSEEVLLITLKLLTAAFPSEASGTDAESSLAPSNLEWLMDAETGLLQLFLTRFLLEFNAAPVRAQARLVLQGVWQVRIPGGAF